jgi:hypothetical protein
MQLSKPLYGIIPERFHYSFYSVRSQMEGEKVVLVYQTIKTKNKKNKFNITRLTTSEQDIQMLICSQHINDAPATKQGILKKKNDK